jgi:hypothetical protein
MEKYIPNFAYCPTKKNEFNKIPFGAITPIANSVRAKIISFCEKRGPIVEFK